MAHTTERRNEAATASRLGQLHLKRLHTRMPNPQTQYLRASETYSANKDKLQRGVNTSRADSIRQVCEWAQGESREYVAHCWYRPRPNCQFGAETRLITSPTAIQDSHSCWRIQANIERLRTFTESPGGVCAFRRADLDFYQEGVCRWPISRVLSRQGRGCSFIKDADCSAPPATYPEVKRAGPTRVCRSTLPSA